MIVKTPTNSRDFSTRFITDDIDYFYGLIFAGCCAALVLIVFFFVIESKDRTLEEIDTMYVQHVNPITSSRWIPNKQHQNEVGEISDVRSHTQNSEK